MLPEIIRAYNSLKSRPTYVVCQKV